MPVERGTQIEDDALTRPCRRPALRHPDDPIDQGHGHHAQAEQRDPAETAPGDGPVDEIPHQKRR